MGATLTLMRMKPEAVDAGTARLVGTCDDRIFAAVSKLLGSAASYGAMSGATV